MMHQRFRARFLTVKRSYAPTKADIASQIDQSSQKEIIKIVPSKINFMDTLINTGLSPLFYIPEEIINNINKKLEVAPFVSVGGKEQETLTGKEVETLQKSSVPWFQLQNASKSLPFLIDLASDKCLLTIAEKYLGVKPILKNITITYSLPCENAQQYYSCHYDIDDYRFIKLFVYLNDVDEDTGPHVYFPYTHLESSLKKLLMRQITCDMTKKYSERKVLMGKKGVAFFEDTFGYHQGTLPKKLRKIMSFTYGISCNTLG